MRREEGKKKRTLLFVASHRTIYIVLKEYDFKFPRTFRKTK
jgi:hypothetical protein